MNSDLESQAAKLPRMVAEILARSRKWREESQARVAEIAAAEAACLKAAEEARRTGLKPHLERCGVSGKTLEAFGGTGLKATPALIGVRKWLEKPEKCFLLLFGGVGGGKSVAAAYSLIRATRAVRTMAHPLSVGPIAFDEYDSKAGLFLTAVQLRFADRFGQGRAVPLMERAAIVPWLVLDELRAADFAGAGTARLEEVLGERYAMGRKTVITTNHTQDELRELVGPRLASRFSEGALAVSCGDSDLRRQAK